MYLLFDIGGTNMRLAVSSDGKTLANTKTVPTPQDFKQGLQDFKNIADELSRGEKIETVAGGIAGPLDKNKTMLVTSPHIGGWVNKSLTDELKYIFKVDVKLENDADIAALGEATSGAGVGKKIVGYLTVSTGVGGGRVVNGKIDQNTLGFEPGHQIIFPDGDPCNCGGKGHLESYVSGTAIERIYGKAGQDLDDPKAWDKVAKNLAIGLNNVSVFWSPDVIILGGSVMKSISLESIRSYLKKYVTIFPAPPEVEIAKLGDPAGLYGALALVNHSSNSV